MGGGSIPLAGFIKMKQFQSGVYLDLLSIERINALYWDEKCTIGEIANKLNISYWTLYDFMKKFNINRRDSSEANYNFNRLKPQFKIKTNLTIAEEKLKIAGIMLYWAEGTLLGKTVDFVNSNPNMVQVFLNFLRQICGVDEKRLRLYLYVYTYQNLSKIKNYWRKITAIPLSQFTKPYKRKRTLNVSNRKLPCGLVHIRYNDKKLLKLIKSWINDYKDIVFDTDRYPSGQRGQTV